MKHRSPTPLSVRWLFACLAVSVIACSSILAPKPDRSRFWVLGSSNATSGAVAGTETLGTREMHIGIGPVTLPGYLKDRRVLVRSGANQLEGLPTDYWAEPLDDGFPRALVYDISEQLKTASALLYPWYSSKRVRWAVPIDVQQFETTSAGEAVLVARWRIIDEPQGNVAFASESRVVEPPAQAGNVSTEQRVAALRRCIKRLGIEIATKIGKLSTPAVEAPAKAVPATSGAAVSPDGPPVPQTPPAPATRPTAPQPPPAATRSPGEGR